MCAVSIDQSRLCNGGGYSCLPSIRCENVRCYLFLSLPLFRIWAVVHCSAPFTLHHWRWLKSVCCMLSNKCLLINTLLCFFACERQFAKASRLSAGCPAFVNSWFLQRINYGHAGYFYWSPTLVLVKLTYSIDMHLACSSFPPRDVDGSVHLPTLRILNWLR